MTCSDNHGLPRPGCRGCGSTDGRRGPEDPDGLAAQGPAHAGGRLEQGQGRGSGESGSKRGLHIQRAGRRGPHPRQQTSQESGEVQQEPEQRAGGQVSSMRGEETGKQGNGETGRNQDELEEIGVGGRNHGK